MKRQRPDSPDLAEAVRQAQSRPALLDELAAIYRDVDAELAAAGQVCRACGRCCDFATYGHRLYVSTIELALLTQSPPPHPAAAAAGRCPWQDGPGCTARDRRALGCRVFSCDEQASPFEQELYARYHKQAQQLHQTHGIDYRYIYLIDALPMQP